VIFGSKFSPCPILPTASFLGFAHSLLFFFFSYFYFGHEIALRLEN